MNRTNRVLLTLWVLCISWGVQAHQPDLSSTILVEKEANKWVLQIRASLTAFEYEVEHHYGKGAYASPEEFRELVIKHIQENLSILFNGENAVIFQHGVVKLGHETSVSFEVVGTPETIQSLTVKNSSFGDISRNQCALIILKKGMEKDQFILSRKNGHTAELVISNDRFALATATQNKTLFFLWVFAAAFLALAVIYFAFKNRRAKKLHVQLQNA